MLVSSAKAAVAAEYWVLKSLEKGKLRSKKSEWHVNSKHLFIYELIDLSLHVLSKQAGKHTVTAPGALLNLSLCQRQAKGNITRTRKIQIFTQNYTEFKSYKIKKKDLSSVHDTTIDYVAYTLLLHNTGVVVMDIQMLFAMQLGPVRK